MMKAILVSFCLLTVTLGHASQPPEARASQPPPPGDPLLQELNERALFFGVAAARIQAELDLHRRINDLWWKCGTDASFTPDDCQKTQKLISEMPDLIREAREHLALSYTDPLKQIVSHDVVDEVFVLNRDLNLQGTFKAVNWAPLSPQERLNGVNKLELIIKDARASAAKKFPDDLLTQDDLTRLLIRDARQQHLMAYRFIMSRFPILQYLAGTDRFERNLPAAVRQVAQNLEQEHARNAQRKQDLSNWILQARDCMREVEHPTVADAPIVNLCAMSPSSSLETMKYVSVLAGMVEDYPEFGAIRARIESEMTRNEIAMAAIQLPAVLAIFSLAPPLVGGALAVALTGYGYAEARSDISLAEQRELSWIFDVTGDERHPRDHLPNEAQLAAAVSGEKWAYINGAILFAMPAMKFVPALSRSAWQMVRAVATSAK